MERLKGKLTPALEAEHRHLKRMVDQAQQDYYRGDVRDAGIKLHTAHTQLKEFVIKHRLNGCDI